MPKAQFHLEVTNHSAFVRMDAGSSRFYALAFSVGLTILGTCALLFLPGKHGSPSPWHYLHYLLSIVGSGGSLLVLAVLFILPMLFSFPAVVFLTTNRYVMLAYPSSETLSCVSSVLSVSKVRWLDVHNNHGDIHAFSLPEVRNIRYGTVAALRGCSIYGILFDVKGKTHRILPGLNWRDAETLLMAFKTFGADVPGDPVISSKLKNDPWRS